MAPGQAATLDPMCAPGTLPSRGGSAMNAQALHERYGPNFGPGSTEYGRMVDRPGPGRPLVVPYTRTAEILQFPFRLHWERNWVFRYMFFGWLAGFPIIYKIHQMANSPENVQKWKEIRKKWVEEAKGNVHH
ncbi:uncharacterized protein LOC129583776 [Paramacrobiotus metropolitanus]|uniref:uncharacterized protein LOC129583776 n=1 Tax=Paramacrobiotus metropolitanus TaxID=2943436 RepID=UPI0024463CE9|nr:uncharacterized protein LOC129583776 [Paramacrobiotus metropolitanus]